MLGVYSVKVGDEVCYGSFCGGRGILWLICGWGAFCDGGRSDVVGMWVRCVRFLLRWG